MIKSLKDLLDKFSRFTNSLVYDGGICKRLKAIKLTNNSNLSKINELNKILMSIYPSSVNIDETIQNKVEEQIDLLTKKDKKILEEIFDSIKHQLPDINYLSEKLSKKKYIAILIYILFSIPSILTIYGEYFKKDGISNSYYKINRNNVRIRTEPSN